MNETITNQRLNLYNVLQQTKTSRKFSSVQTWSIVVYEPDVVSTQAVAQSEECYRLAQPAEHRASTQEVNGSVQTLVRLRSLWHLLQPPQTPPPLFKQWTRLMPFWQFCTWVI